MQLPDLTPYLVLLVVLYAALVGFGFAFGSWLWAVLVGLFRTRGV